MVFSMQSAVNCTVVGDGFVGKSCLVQKIAGGKFHQEYVATLKDNYSTKLSLNGDSFEMNITDIAGEHEDLFSLEVPDIYIVCFSLVDKDSLDSVEEFWIPDIQSLDQSVPIVLVGTQLDMRKPFDSRHITSEQGQNAAKRLGADYYVECSAKENSGIRETFQKAVMAKIRNEKKKLEMIKRMLNR
ncbi:cdc42 homolog [Crassostrea angulata]|uniref:cdc42 homolog n=1 Tax=Magallana angulata TaxID=2784310 RepID=UPI0022B1C213|nr:cdc42 homolog [Crassostrea angulata]